MSIYEAKMPSLKDKIREQAVKSEVEVKEVDVSEEVEVKVKKGRRLNK